MKIAASIRNSGPIGSGKKKADGYEGNHFDKPETRRKLTIGKWAIKRKLEAENPRMVIRWDTTLSG